MGGWVCGCVGVCVCLCVFVCLCVKVGGSVGECQDLAMPSDRIPAWKAGQILKHTALFRHASQEACNQRKSLPQDCKGHHTYVKYEVIRWKTL